jgi:two-component system LytT family response regulator
VRQKTKLRTIIVDDELHCIKSLQAIIEDQFTELEIIRVCSSSKDGLFSIKELKPDLVFLDVEMPWMTGIELLELVRDIAFYVIFTTAHDQYAVQAFRLSAVDYLLKPIEPSELAEAVSRVHGRSKKEVKSNRDQLHHNLQGTAVNHRVGVSTKEGIDFVLVEDILYCQADGNYAHIHLVNKSRLMMSKPLKEIEQQLASYNFCRIHQSYLINLNHLEKYVRGTAGYVIMNDKTSINVSRSRKEELMSRLGMT